MFHALRLEGAEVFYMFKNQTSLQELQSFICNFKVTAQVSANNLQT